MIRFVFVLFFLIIGCDYDDDNDYSIELVGCMDNQACNYLPNAEVDDGSCFYESQCWDDSEECDVDDCPTYNNVDIYDVWKQLTDLQADGNGYYHFTYEPTGDYSNSDYGTVKYSTELPTTRVYWNSPDSFWVYWQGQWWGEPIINYSTYSGDDGYGQQLFYVYEPHIGDTLSIYGHICEDTNFGGCDQNPLSIDSVFVIIE